MDENEFEEDDAGEEEPQTEELGYFAVFEKSFHETLNTMRDNESLAAFGEDYTKLFEAFEDTYKRELSLIQQKEQLEEKVNDLNAEVKKIFLQADRDTRSLETCRAELENAWKLCDNAHAREQQSQEIIENMRTQIVKLNNELEIKSKLDSDDVGEGNLNKTKEGFEREKQRMLDEIISLKQKLANALSYSEELEHKNSAADLRNNELTNMIEEAAANAAKQQRSIDKLTMDLKATTEEKIRLQTELQEMTETITTMTKNTTNLENVLKESKASMEKSKKENELLTIKIEKYKLELEIMTTDLKESKEKLHKKNSQIKELDEENVKLRSEFSKLSKTKENIEKRLDHTEKAKATMEVERNKLRHTTSMMEKELQGSRKQNDTDKRTIENLAREKEILHKNFIRVQNVSEQHVKLIKIQEQSKRKMENDINNLKNEAVAHKKEMNKMEKDRNRAIEETMDLTQQVEDAMDEIKLKQQEVYELKRTILETESKLRQQQNLFEVVRADRNAFQKQLQESVAETGELKAKLKISTHQAEQLKEDIAAKEAMLLKSENILRKVNKEKENLKVEVQNKLDYIARLKKDINELQQSEKRLTKTVQQNEMAIRTQAKELEQIMNDRDIIGAQLVRRNDELGLLYEKINILQITLRRGETQYDQRIEDIRLLKLEIKRLRQERNLLSKNIQAMTDLRHEVFQLERELAQERLKTKAMEEEIQHPLNIHRWRKLEGSDPQVLELLQKIQILQKRLLAQTSQAVEREKQLKETERLYLNLRQVLARQPGPEIKEELGRTRKALQFRGTKMKCLVSELNMCESQMHEYKMDLERLTEELREVKAKYLRQKKLNQKLIPVPKKVSSEETPSTKFTGGGFKMAPQPPRESDEPCPCDL